MVQLERALAHTLSLPPHRVGGGGRAAAAGGGAQSLATPEEAPCGAGLQCPP